MTPEALQPPPPPPPPPPLLLLLLLLLLLPAHRRRWCWYWCCCWRCCCCCYRCCCRCLDHSPPARRSDAISMNLPQNEESRAVVHAIAISAVIMIRNKVCVCFGLTDPSSRCSVGAVEFVVVAQFLRRESSFLPPPFRFLSLFLSCCRGKS